MARKQALARKPVVLNQQEPWDAAARDCPMRDVLDHGHAGDDVEGAVSEGKLVDARAVEAAAGEQSQLFGQGSGIGEVARVGVDHIRAQLGMVG